VKLRFIGKFARFDNLDGPSLVEDMIGGFQPSRAFDQPATITRGSKMNDMAEEAFGSSGEEEAPF